MNKRFALLAGAATLAALIAPEAMAQTAPASGGDEIVVTAQRRAERAQDVPIVITAFSSEQLSKQNVTQAQDLYGTAPSLVVGNQGQATRDVQSFSIRGQSTGFLASPAVAQYFAEVPLPASVSLNLQGAPGLFVDLENVQVLSGPQGTLFGRNTTGGAVLFVPKKPSNEVEGYVEGQLGNYSLRSVEGALNVPLISDKLMVRIAGTYHDRDGFTRDLMFNKNRDNQHYYAGRISILAKPVEGLSNLTIIHGVKSSNNGTGFIHQGFNIPGLKAPTVGFCADPGETFGALALPCDAYRSQTTLAEQIGPRQTRLNNDEFSNIDMWGVINTTELEFGDSMKLRNIISYQRLRDNYSADQDATPIQQYELNQNSPALPPGTVVAGLSPYGVPLFGYTNATPNFEGQRDDIKQFTQELQLQGSGLDKHLDYAVGFFHYSAVPGSVWGSKAINYCPVLYTGLCGFSDSLVGVSNKSDAVYAQGTLDLGALSPALEKLRLTAGARHTWDTVEGYAIAWRPSNTSGPGFVSCLKNGLFPADVADANKLTDCRFDSTLKSRAFTWTIGLDYKPTNNIMIYGKVSRGYKAGGFNTFAVRTETRTFEPEQLTSYEIGFKSNWRLGEVPVKFNATYYYSDYNNIQRPTGDFNPATSGSGARILAAKARIQGIELEGSIRPVTGLELGGNFSYTDPKYKKFDVPIIGPTVTCSGLQTSGTGDFTCMPFQFVTKYIYNVYASLDLPVGENLGDLSFYVNYSHVSAQGTAPLGNAITQPGSVLDGFGLLNASVTWKRAAGTPVDLSVFGTNLTDSLYRTSNSNTFDNLLVRSTVYGEPRMYGVKVRVNF